MDLTQDELEFLDKQNFSSEDVLDSKAMSQKECKEESKRLGKKILLGTPCKEAGHRLRTRHGHCAQCDTSKIAYEGRYSQKGYVYIAGSVEKNWIKVGYATDITQRETSLRNKGYGGARDWFILLYFKIKNAGRIEKQIQLILKDYESSQTYIKEGRKVDVLEVFQCSFDEAYKALYEVLGSESNYSDSWVSKNLAPYKSFPNIKGSGLVRKGNTK